MIYVELLWSFFQIGLFSIGGGYAAMPLIQHQVVDLHPWLDCQGRWWLRWGVFCPPASL